MVMPDGSTFIYHKHVERDCGQRDCPWSASYVRPPPKTPTPEPQKTNGHNGSNNKGTDK